MRLMSILAGMALSRERGSRVSRVTAECGSRGAFEIREAIIRDSGFQWIMRHVLRVAIVTIGHKADSGTTARRGNHTGIRRIRNVCKVAGGRGGGTFQLF